MKTLLLIPAALALMAVAARAVEPEPVKDARYCIMGTFMKAQRAGLHEYDQGDMVVHDCAPPFRTAMRALGYSDPVITRMFDELALRVQICRTFPESCGVNFH